jgi:hypothetical protein
MDFYKKRVMISKQGRAINHLHPEYFTNPIKRPIPDLPDSPETINITGVLSDEKKQQKNEKKAKKSQPVKLNYSFKAISREKYNHITRNKTESPRVGLYNPNWQVVRPSTARAPQLLTKKTTPRDKKIFTPICMTQNLNCSFPVRDSTEALKAGSYNERLKRTMSNFNDYLQRVETSRKPLTEPASMLNTLNSIVFDKQLTRKEFVTEKNPPNEKRFSFLDKKSDVCTKNKKIKSFLFAKSTFRQELFKTKETLGPYEKFKDINSGLKSTVQIKFDKMPDRKELLLYHQLITPNSPTISDCEQAYLKQSNVRGIYKIPLMASVTPRDDLMYRVTEAYKLNVPTPQSADSKPQYMGPQREIVQDFIDL